MLIGNLSASNCRRLKEENHGGGGSTLILKRPKTLFPGRKRSVFLIMRIVWGLGLSSFSGQGDEDDLKRRQWDPGRRRW